MNKQLSRKYQLSVFIVASLNILVWFGKIDASLYVTALVATAGGYLAANVVEGKSKNG